MNRSPIIFAGLFVLSGLWAYSTWTRAPQATIVKGQVALWPGDAKNVKSVRLEMDKKNTELTVRPDGSIWIRAEKSVPKPKSELPGSGSGAVAKAGAGSGADSQAAATSAAPPALDKQVQDYPAGEEAQTLLERLAPLMALRDLGVVSGEQQAAFGFDKPTGTLVLTSSAAERRLELGGRVYGGEDRYVRDVQSGRAYVVAADVVRPLEFPESSLRLRKFHDFARDVITAARVTVGTQGRDLLRQAASPDKKPSPAPTSTPMWVDATSPDQPNQTLSNFMDRVWQVAPLDYLGLEDKATGDPALRIEYLGLGGKPLGTFELYELPAGDARGKYLARSDRTGVLARVPAQVAERLMEDLRQIFVP